MRRLLKRFAASEAGNFAVVTAIAIIPVAGLSGLAVDYSQAYSVRSTLQGEADAIALAVAAEGPSVTTSRFYAPMQAAAKERVALGEAQFQGRWISPSDYEVTATAAVPRSLSRLIPVGGKTIDVDVRSVTRYMGVRLVYKPPATKLLDPNAWDYNRIYAYCYDGEKGKTNRAAARTQRTAIADNSNGKYDDPMPQCGSGEVLSFELFNIIEGKHRPANMTSPTATTNRHFTDTTRGGTGNLVDAYDPSVGPILETVLCPSLAVCHTDKKKGGVLPSGNKRVPQRHTGACPKGQFLYYGWEDRINGDNDFDDIRIVIECPELVTVGTENVRLLR